MQEPIAFLSSTDLKSGEDRLVNEGWAVLQPQAIAGGIENVLRHFGTPILQPNGKMLHEVTVDYNAPKDPLLQSKGNGAIGPHTEGVTHDPPPRYLALYCHRQARCGGGRTLLSDGFGFYNSLSEDLRIHASSDPVDFHETKKKLDRSLHEGQSLLSKLKTLARNWKASGKPEVVYRSLANAPIMDMQGDQRIVRYSFNLFRFVDEGTPLHQIVHMGKNYFYENCSAILIPEKHMLIWDNYRMMHARSEYTDSARHLTRYWLN